MSMTSEELIYLVISEGVRLIHPRCPSCDKKINFYHQAGSIALINNHTTYLLCKKCHKKTGHFHTRTYFLRTEHHYQRYAFITVNDCTTEGWALLLTMLENSCDEAVRHV